METRSPRDGRNQAIALGVAYRALLVEMRRLGWTILWAASGLGLQVITCAEDFVVDSAEALERRRPQPGSGWATQLDSRLSGVLRQRLVRAARLCEPGIRAWRGQVARADAALFEACVG